MRYCNNCEETLIPKHEMCFYCIENANREAELEKELEITKGKIRRENFKRRKNELV